MVLADGARPTEDVRERLSKVAQEFERECNLWVTARERPDWILAGVVTRELNGVNLDALEEESWLPIDGASVGWGCCRWCAGTSVFVACSLVGRRRGAAGGESMVYVACSLVGRRRGAGGESLVCQCLCIG